MEWDELENALAWFKSAPGDWVKSGKQNLAAAAEWVWEVIQGDFAEDKTTAQVVTGTVISMIPFVDQICDVRDVVANCKKINQDTANKWAWIALILTLIGLFPVLGSLAKGGCKILFAYGRKSVFRAGKAALDANFWTASQPFVEAGIQKLNQYLQSPSVRAALKAARILNPYKWLATKVREVTAKLNVGELGRAFDKVLEAFQFFVDLIKRWGTAAMATRAGQLLESVVAIRKLMNTKIGEFIAPVTAWLNKLARRLDIEADMLHRANVDAVNPHKYAYPTLGQDKVEIKLNRPTWVDETLDLDFPPLDEPPRMGNWPAIDEAAPPALKNAFRSFHSAKPVTIPAGEKLYRVVDPTSNDNSICWMRESEFKELKSRDEWRRYFAVWRHWNRNGEYVTYTVPPGGLRVWEGVTAGQKLKGTDFVTPGGGIQIVLDPSHLQIEYLGKRKPTGWGYTDFPGDTDEFLGLPKLTTKIKPENTRATRAM